MANEAENKGSLEQKEYKDWGVTLVSISKKLENIRRGDKIEIIINHSELGPIRLRRERDSFMSKHFPASVGICFVLIATALTFSFSDPTALQTHVILAMFSLGGGAFAAEIPGIINIDLNLGQQVVIGATGAAAIFVILFFFVPATLTPAP